MSKVSRSQSGFSDHKTEAYLVVIVITATPEELIRKDSAVVVLEFELKVLVHLIAGQQNLVVLVIQTVGIGILIRKRKNITQVR